MAIICDNDMEIILKGSSEETIRKMLDNRFFALIKMPVKKNHSSPCSSSVFVGFVNEFFIRSFAIRKANTKTVFEDCEYYLTMRYKRGADEESKGYFDKTLKEKEDAFISVTYPTVDELVEFLHDKELVLITNYIQYGHFESFKNKDFLEDILFLWEDSESDFIPVDEFLDVRIHLIHTEVENAPDQFGIFPDDVRNFDIRRRLVDMFRNSSKKYFYDDQYYSAEYEAQTKDIQAAYYVTRFHSNPEWDADPINIINARFSVFVLSGTVPPEEAEILNADKKTTNHLTGEKYVIDSIYCDSDIFFDLDEFEEYVDMSFKSILYD